MVEENKENSQTITTFGHISTERIYVLTNSSADWRKHL